ncbi:MAG: long-chain fatty acid--CoA ligase [Clostridiales bacterium]|jgi:long-chain acyl-CoA synthetase|nr:long-chain fatty acid--CoA ligase [Clostridiales bacterium]
MRKYKCKYDIEFQDLKEIMDFVADKYGDNTGFIYKTPDRTQKVEITYNKFREDLDAIGAYLISKGLRDKRIVVIGPNSYTWLAAYYGIVINVGVVVPLDRALPEDEIINSLRKCKADAIVYDESLDMDFEKIIKTDGVSVTTLIPMSELSQEALVEHAKLIPEYKSEFKVIDKHATDIILFTSGTSADAKAAQLSQRNIASTIAAMRKVEPIYEDDVEMILLPLHHAFGNQGVLMFISNGATNVFCSGLKYIQKELKEYGVTAFFCVPLIIETLVGKVLKTAEKEGKLAKLEMGRKMSKALMKVGIDARRKIFKDVIDGLGGKLRFLISGASALDPKILEYTTDFGIMTVQGYGLTETAPTIASESYFYRRAGSVGHAMPGVEVKINDPDENGIGELYAMGPNIMKGYLDDEEANAAVFDNGWFNTGDLARIDEDGYIFITGRMKNVIVLKNGKNVYPEEVETLIDKLPYVVENVVMGEEKGADYRVVAHIVYDPEAEEVKGKSVEEIQAMVDADIEKINDDMPKYKSIRQAYIRTEPFEKTTTQKIKRRKVNAK